MKVVLFCGGLGTRLRRMGGEDLPKPMVHIGYRPILWHVMKYYAHFGHTEFILCLGYKSDVIKRYFLDYDERVSNNFTLSEGGRRIDLETSDIDRWKVTFVDTGLRSNVGQRLKAVRKYVQDDEMFLANYCDGLTDLFLPDQIDAFTKSGKIACFLCVKPSQSFHVVKLNEDNLVDDIQFVCDSDIVINGGFFAFRREIFDHIEDGEELVAEPFQRLIEKRQVMGYPYHSFWCMDTFKEQQELSDMYERGDAPWEIWKKPDRT